MFTVTKTYHGDETPMYLGNTSSLDKAKKMLVELLVASQELDLHPDMRVDGMGFNDLYASYEITDWS